RRSVEKGCDLTLLRKWAGPDGSWKRGMGSEAAMLPEEWPVISCGLRSPKEVFMKRVLIPAALVTALGLCIGLDASAAAGGSPGRSSSMASPTTSNAATHQMTTKTPGTTSTANGPNAATAVRGPARTGQPNQNCEALGNTPGHAASAPGSPFNPDGNA